MKRDSKTGRFVAEVRKPICVYEADCTDDKCLNCANRRKRSYYRPESIAPLFYYTATYSELPGQAHKVRVDTSG